jgi:hypothetical protein
MQKCTTDKNRVQIKIIESEKGNLNSKFDIVWESSLQHSLEILFHKPL